MAGPNNKKPADLTVAATTGHQLFLADILRSPRRTRHPAPAAARGPARALIAVPASMPSPVWTQELLCDPARDCRYVSSLDPPRDPGFLDLVLRQAEELAELHSWPPHTLQPVRRRLRMLASCHDPGEPIKASTVTALVPGLRVLEVLTAAADGLVVEDRPDSLTVWIDKQFAALPPSMRQELQAWIDVLRQGTPRRRARPRRTVFKRLANIRPFLLECATRYHTLRQVTREDVLAWLEGRKHQTHDASALRGLFGTLKSQRLVFTNPTHRIRMSAPNRTTPRPLSPESLQRLGEAAEDNPALRAVLALTGVHALGPKQVRDLRLDQVDMANQRLDVNGTHRTLDPFTATAISSYLDYRHARWPHTSNPHLLTTSRTAREQTPVSEHWLATLFRGLPATPSQLREDRILEEARATGADPLHLTAMFGLDGKTGLRYAHAVHPELIPPDS